MRDLSLHLLDLIENSIRAKATVVAVTLSVSQKNDRLVMRIEDNGPGFSAPAEMVLSPFYTTKKGKKTGLGLSLLQSAAQRAGGDLALGRSSLGGARVEASMQLSHLDRSPLGDLAATFSALACTHPEIELRLSLTNEDCESPVANCELASGGRITQSPAGRCSGLEVAREMAKRIQAGVANVWPGIAT